MLHQAAIASLRSWEAGFPVATWAVNGLHVWPLIRQRLAQDLLAVGREPRAGEGPGDAVRRWMTLGADRFRERPAARRHITTAEAVILTRPANRQWLGGRWYDRLFDPITDALELEGWSVLHLEHRADGSSYHTPRYRPALVTRPAVTRRNLIAALQAVRGASLPEYEAFASTVRRAHPAVSAPTPVWIARRARSIESASRVFERVLRRTGARLTFCSVYYTLVGMALCLASRRLGIPSVDVQHGVTLGNPAYEGWSQFPPGGYSVLPRWFWAWSEADADPIQRWPAGARPHHLALSGGHPWMVVWSSGHPLALASEDQLPPRAAGGLTVLVTLTWSSGLSDFLKELVADAPANWVWWVRLHPLMNRERDAVRLWCDRHARGRAFVDAPSDLPLPLLLTHADVHVTHNSTVVQEAARAGIASVVVDEHALDVYPEVRSGWAAFAATPREAIAAIASRPSVSPLLPRPSPYPSWSEFTSAVHRLMALPVPCPDTAATASSPTRGRA